MHVYIFFFLHGEKYITVKLHQPNFCFSDVKPYVKQFIFILLLL